MGGNIERTLKNKAQAFEFFALALGGNTVITNSAQLNDLNPKNKLRFEKTRALVVTGIHAWNHTW